MVRAAMLMLSLVSFSAYADAPVRGTQPSKLTLGTVDAVAVQMIDLQIAALRSRITPVGVAVALTSVGSFGFTLGLGTMVIASMTVGTLMMNPIAMIVGLAIAGASSLPLMIGVVWLVLNLTHNGRIKAAIQELSDERKILDASALSPMPMWPLAKF